MVLYTIKAAKASIVVAKSLIAIKQQSKKG